MDNFKYPKLERRIRKKLVKLLKNGNWCIRRTYGITKGYTASFTHVLTEVETGIRVEIHIDYANYIALEGMSFRIPFFDGGLYRECYALASFFEEQKKEKSRWEIAIDSFNEKMPQNL